MTIEVPMASRIPKLRPIANAGTAIAEASAATANRAMKDFMTTSERRETGAHRP